MVSILRNATFAVFDSAHVRSIEVASRSKFLLRKPGLISQLPYPCPEPDRNVRPPRHCRGLLDRCGLRVHGL